MKTNPNDPMCPAKVGFSDGIQQESFQSDNTVGTYMGLTKREYFAAMALQGLIPWNKSGKIDPDSYAMLAVACADALIQELNK